MRATDGKISFDKATSPSSCSPARRSWGPPGPRALSPRPGRCTVAVAAPAAPGAQLAALCAPPPLYQHPRTHARAPRDRPPRLAYSRLVSVQVVDMMHHQRFLTTEGGRFFVALSLEEAQAVRSALHCRRGRPLIDGARTGLCLRTVAPPASENSQQVPKQTAARAARALAPRLSLARTRRALPRDLAPPRHRRVRTPVLPPPCRSWT